MYILKNEGYNTHRLAKNPREAVYKEQFEKLMLSNPDGINQLVGKKNKNNQKQFLTEDEEKIALSVIQWLGSPVGQNFVNKAEERIVKENISDSMYSLFSQFRWIIKTGTEQKNGSCADIYAENIDNEYGTHSMRIDDGNCHNELLDAVYHIYATCGKIFEGRIGTPDDFIVVMKVLGFKKK